MIRLWRGFFKPLGGNARSDSYVILHKELFHTPEPQAGDIVHVDTSGYFKIAGDPKFNDRHGYDWFEVEIGRRVKTKEVRRRTRQKYQLKFLRDLRSRYKDDPDDVEAIERHIKMCMEDNHPDAALVGWVMCIEAVDKGFIDTLKHQKSREVESKEKAESFGWTDDVKSHRNRIKELDYTIEGVTALLEQKRPGLCSHAWDCDE